MITSFKPLHEAAARVASSSYIERSGIYTVTIAQAHVSQSQGGATCVNLDLKTDIGELCFVQMWVLGKDGGRLFSHDIFDALLVVLGVPEAQVKQAKVFDRFTNDWVDGYRIPAIEKKKLGVVLQKVTDYVRTKKNGDPRISMELLTPFDLSTRKIAKEILTDAPASRIDQIEDKGVKDKTIYPKEDAQPQTAQQPAALLSPKPETADDGWGDVPF